MEQKEFTYLLQEPSAITAAQTQELQAVLTEFPYFQAARALRLKGLKNENSLQYNQELRIAAAYTTDRSVLFDFITSEEFNQNEIAHQIRKQELDSEKASKSKIEQKILDLEKALKQKTPKEDQSREPEFKIKFQKKTENDSDENSERDLNIGSPLNFKKEENHSFSEWLKLTQAEPIDRTSATEEPSEEKSRKFDLIDEFISKNHRIKPGKTGKKQNLADANQTAPEALMTETLARVYLEQKNFKKAIQAYKILILKNPEKSGFFADQIRAIEKLQEQNNQ